MPDSKPQRDVTTIFAPLVFNVLTFHALTAAVSLGLPDALADGSLRTKELAAVAGADEDSLLRLLRTLSVFGVVHRDGEDTWSLAGAGDQLRDGAAEGPADFIRFYGNPLTWRAFGAMEESVRTGTAAFEQIVGEAFYAYQKSDTAYARSFNGAMRAGREELLPILVDGYDWGTVRHLVDVGGGDGNTLAAIAAAHPALRGTVVDTEDVIRAVPGVVRDAGVSERCTGSVGDFLTGVPAGGDAYLLKHVLFEWDDASCTEILRNCREAMTEDGRVLVVTALMPEWDAEDPLSLMVAAVNDVQLMCLGAGRERGEKEYSRLFSAAGLRLRRVIPLPDLPNYHIVEAVRARSDGAPGARGQDMADQPK
ncbi:methyltransferase [Streptomyces sp. NBC_00237]|uniref:methyltransferase n=1 Tax=Streptomyces sp. NBC_00237 TaxID=2975687 RepID=UPI002256D121|nr:methyltransferase [Streptomyces sp. NBC_00237]MCX5206324.1 methyltransferase [Streptomyces sp. NBC_00237]